MQETCTLEICSRLSDGSRLEMVEVGPPGLLANKLRTLRKVNGEICDYVGLTRTDP